MTTNETKKYAQHVAYLSGLLEAATKALEQLERQNAQLKAENESLKNADQQGQK